MSNKLKNIISNLIGLGVIALGTVKYLENDNLINFVSLLAVGLACFLFKGSETKAWLLKILKKKIDGIESNNPNYKLVTSAGDFEDGEGNGDSDGDSNGDTIGSGDDPDKEEK